MLHPYAFPCSHIEESTIHQPEAGFETTSCLKCLQIIGVSYMAGGSALKLETGYCVSYLDSALQKGASSCKLCFSSLFAFLPFHKAEEVQHIPFIPSDSHRGFYFPPTSNTDRAVNIIEIKYFIILWTYSQ